MGDFLLVVGGIGIMVAMAAILAFFEGCAHKWSSWEYKEDSAVFFQKRQCSKCGYTQFEQVRKIVEKQDGL